MKKLFRQKKSRAQGCALKRGSALLIVLGFLSFMMVSAVSFAIYMRIERQASSNYRHAITARHMLNAALYRAMDEIDGELRIQRINSEADVRPCKFPEWPGRTKPSAVANGQDNGEDARVLSMESLSFIPGMLVNDVRRYAVSNQNDIVSGVSFANNRFSYLGAKWRKLSMPVTSLGSSEDNTVANAYEEAVVGRYSYLCVNVSDMLDVNVCKAALRNAESNRVSIGQFFGPNSQATRDLFDDYVEEQCIRFDTLQDFYACMYAKKAVAPSPANASPYHDYMKAGNANDCDAGFDEAANHVFITDAIAKGQPANQDALNVIDTRYRNSISAAAEDFATQLSTIPTLVAGNASNTKNFYRCLLTDYLDEDCQPGFLSGVGVGPLFRPSVEMVPMVDQIVVKDNLQPEVYSTTVGAGPTAVTTFKLRLHKMGMPLPVSFQCIFPFKNWLARKTENSSLFDFTLDARAFLVLCPMPAGAPNLKTKDSQLMDPGPAFYFPLTPMTAPKPLPGNESTLITANPVPFSVPDCSIDLYDKDSSGAVTWKPGFAAGMQIRIALVVFAGVKQNGTYVDLAPGYWNPGSPAPNNLNTAISDKFFDRLFFQTDPITLGPAMPAAIPCAFTWKSLEVPDPRYNHKTANWIVGSDVEKTDITKTYANKLVGKDGRDGDVYMAVSNAKRLFSPGEFGFLPRAVVGVGSPPVSVELATITDETKVADNANMFRTIRLYDHTAAFLQDKIYNYFTAQNADGSVPGARVNPLSDRSQILTAAIDQTPADYWYASLDVVSDKTIMRNNTFNKFLSNSDWNKFTNAWSLCFMRLRASNEGRLMRTSWQYGVSDYYGNLDKFGWAVAADPYTIFSPIGYTSADVPASLSTPLHEIDRKMLYSFSLDSFSDRQQLFLYILRAEVTVPSFGSTKETAVKSLAGGRAVALVWRDPYPVGYNKSGNSWATGAWYNNIKRVSPWTQVNLRKYDDDLEENQAEGDSDITSRFNGFHQQRILYFKQLDN